MRCSHCGLTLQHDPQLGWHCPNERCPGIADDHEEIEQAERERLNELDDLSIEWEEVVPLRRY